MALILLSQLVFGFAWSLDLIQALIAGILISGTVVAARTTPGLASRPGREGKGADGAPSPDRPARLAGIGSADRRAG